MRPVIAGFRYLGLPDVHGQELAVHHMTGFGVIETIEVDGNGAATGKVDDCLQLFRLAPILGGT